MKIIYTVLATLIVSATLGLFTLNSRVTTLEAKVPAIEKSHDKAQVMIFNKLNYITKRIDDVHVILTKHK